MGKLFLFLVLIANGLIAQDGVLPRIHSHNDYLQNVPFWKAYAAGASSIEADVFLVGDSLFVAHAEEEIDVKRSLERLYFEPLQEALALGLNRPKKLQLLIDVKSEPYATLDAIIQVLDRYPSIRGDDGITVAISGNRPKPTEYLNYPDYIFFDYQSLDVVEDSAILEKIALISLSFRNFSEWNGKGRLTAQDLEKVLATIEKAHALGKPFRFWATPDSKTAWKAFSDLGVDFVNTDMPFECTQYINTLPDRYYQNTKFSEVYHPTFATDGTNQAVENIILMIGDGNGLAQISATAMANKGALSLTQLKNMGLLKTQSADDFTTDSAGAGTALATGKKVPNRAIGNDSQGNPLENITELLAKKGFVSGIITTDEISGATPSSFYAHRQDRSMSEGIMDDFAKSPLTLFISTENPNNRHENSTGDFSMLSAVDEVGKSKKDKIGFLMPGKIASGGNNELAKATDNALRFFENTHKPFFLMVEGAKIDSYGHENDIGGIISEGIGFDKAITEALKFADQNSNTLVIITADHETGGLTLPQGNLERNEIEGDFTTHDHTALMVPIFAYGPQSNQFQGVYENSEVFHKILKVLKVQE
ncbi:alkaline phosphatase [Pricia antarctica]|uniref:Alkaline phosphatase n=1 Tax=Pricia antarctica TaxID=641691 RepID=A0A1G6WW47_9FLAO|nr:alkaline phosphatase [Pricia antarctica]SDD69306.1 alkaline phosphatase [Pricia antarctica]